LPRLGIGDDLAVDDLSNSADAVLGLQADNPDARKCRDPLRGEVKDLKISYQR